jgi:amino acid adenylation domain-containing protein
MKTSLYNYFTETAERFEEKIAVVEGDQSWTFRQLQQATHVLAGALLQIVTHPNAVIAVLLKKSFNAVVSDLAITGIGCVYMNLDIKSPAARIKQILDVIAPSIVITNAQGLEMLSQICNSTIQILNVDDIHLDEIGGVGNPGESRLASLIDTDPYCVINTSGSTGIPKGVVLNHRSFVDFMDWSADELDVNGSEVIGSLSPIIFDIFSYELCMLIFKGSTICLIDERLAPYPAKILEVLEKNRVSYIFWVPTIMVNIASMGLLEKFSLSDLKSVWFAGEVFPTVHFNKWFDRLPDVRFVNLYGPIEITLDCTFYPISKRIPDDQPIPIGHPCTNTALLVLNEDGTETPDGQIGELYVRGTSLAMGYYNNPEQTARAFIQNPLNKNYPDTIYKSGDLVMRREGLYHFKGRADTMIKHLGYRIELADIEHAILSSIPAVRNVCVVYSQNNKEIVAYCELQGGLTIQSLRAVLGQKLPAYMIPSRLEEVEHMPMNANGKIDRLHFKRMLAEPSK